MSFRKLGWKWFAVDATHDVAALELTITYFTPVRPPDSQYENTIYILQRLFPAFHNGIAQQKAISGQEN